MMHSLQTKIFIFCVALLLGVTSLILSFVYRTTYIHTQTQIAEQLASGYRVVQNELESRKRYVGSSSRTITKDFNLIEQVMSRDAVSIGAALDNYRNRAGATFSIVTDTNGVMIATTAPEFILGKQLPFGSFNENQLGNSQSLFGISGENIYQVFIWPLYAPEPNQIAWVVMAYQMDDRLTERLHQLTGLEVSIFNQGTVFASSLPMDIRATLLTTSLNSLNDKSRRAITLNNIEYVTYQASIFADNHQAVTILLQRSLTDALRDYNSLILQFIIVQVICMLLAAIGALFISRTMTRPLRRITEYVKSIALGEYSEPLPLNIKGEMGILAAEFTKMQREISEREASILHFAYHDSLTNLPNRNDFLRHLKVQIESAGASQSRFAVLEIDLDNFSEINITLGHISGDHLLKKIAERLQYACAEGHKVARLGGDEFAVLISNVKSLNEAIQWVQEYRNIFNKPFEVEGFSLTINSTIGVAIYPDHAENVGTLMQRAEVAMYVGKHKKIPYCIYNASQDHHSVVRLALMSELKSAVEDDALELFYQPKLDIASNTIYAVECLVRWNHPVHGFIIPDEFIPLAEQTGNIRLLTRWVLNTAFAQNKKWRDNLNADFKICINISAVDLLDPQILLYLESKLLEHELPPESVILEVTESSVMDDPEKAIAMLSQINALGIDLSIDDFGTGYSSLVQLKRLPVHELKIDKSFVVDVINNPDDVSIVRATIELAHNLNLKVVAEGVETQATLDLLKTFNCDVIQGFYLSKPISASMFETWLTNTQYLVARLP
jgi:diguanylate cyclase (GGDEF)-like protein